MTCGEHLTTARECWSLEFQANGLPGSSPRVEAHGKIDGPSAGDACGGLAVGLGRSSAGINVYTSLAQPTNLCLTKPIRIPGPGNSRKLLMHQYRRSPNTGSGRV